MVWDWSLLIAATAVGLMSFRALFNLDGLGDSVAELIGLANDVADWRSFVTAAYRMYGSVVLLFVPFCAPWTVAVLAVRLRRPPPSDSIRQPGAVACISMGLGSVLASIQIAFKHTLEAGSGSWWPGAVDVDAILFFGVPVCGATVLGSWVGLLLSGGWRAEASWIDRAGRLLGAFWIGTVGLAIESSSHLL
jgi:hypothetical protein